MRDEAILASIGDGVITIDKNGVIIFINDAAEKLLQVKVNAVIGKRYQDVWWVEDKNGKRISDDKRPMEVMIRTKKRIQE